MRNAAHIIGLSDEGLPVVAAEGICEHWSPGSSPTVGRQECWYCRWADFRKTTEVILRQSVCRCPQNRLAVVHSGKNENMGDAEEGYRHG